MTTDVNAAIDVMWAISRVPFLKETIMMRDKEGNYELVALSFSRLVAMGSVQLFRMCLNVYLLWYG